MELTPPRSPNRRSVNQLFFGDNLNVLRESLADESVDLIYPDPPFNSKRDYNLLFKTPPKSKPVAGNVSSLKSSQSGPTSAATTDYSSAQLTAFEDSWHRGEQAGREFDELVPVANSRACNC
jgi:site-specific DNA-methyltransferase (adenine-specific)